MTVLLARDMVTCDAHEHLPISVSQCLAHFLGARVWKQKNSSNGFSLGTGTCKTVAIFFINKEW